MPNICTTNYVIEGKKEELDTLYQKMKELQEMEQPLVENNLGPTWLGCLVKALQVSMFLFSLSMNFISL